MRVKASIEQQKTFALGMRQLGGRDYFAILPKCQKA